MQGAALNLSGKRILVTGATSDIGMAIARSCASAGAIILGTGRSKNLLDRLSEELRPALASVSAIDFTAGNAVAETADWLRPFLPVDGFVHCAGLHNITPLRVLSRDKVIDAMAVNYVVPLEITKLIAGRGGCPASGASVVYITSIAAHHGQAGLTAYAGSKGALGSAAAGLARELAPKRIRVNCIVPGWVRTRAAETAAASMSDDERAVHEAQYPLGLGGPEDVAGAVLFLLSPLSRWITGTNLFVDGGYSA